MNVSLAAEGEERIRGKRDKGERCPYSDFPRCGKRLKVRGTQ